MLHKYNYKTMDVSTWNRAAHFEMYRECGFPFVGLTVDMDVTELVKYCKREKLRFFRVFMHLLMRTVGDMENFRLRIDDGKAVLFEMVDPSFTALDAATELFYIAVAEYANEYSRFEQAVEQAEAKALRDKCLSEKRLDLVYVTCVPWLSFSELIQPIFINHADSVPRFAWGRFKEVDGRIVMPFSLSGHHGFIDGVHIARFVEALQRGIAC